jgi:hypothetical protein
MAFHHLCQLVSIERANAFMSSALAPFYRLHSCISIGFINSFISSMSMPFYRLYQFVYIVYDAFLKLTQARERH